LGLKYQEENGRSKGGENMTRAVSNFLQEASYYLSGMHKRFPRPAQDLAILPTHVQMQLDLNLITETKTM
jgi:hypothetical protein